jgi:fatty-acyl-CoA synthase
MTETTPLGSLSVLRKELEEASPDEQYKYRAKAGMPVPGMDIRIIDDEGNEVPRDGEAMGELQVRGPWVVDAYLDRPEENKESFTDDGWLKTGDIATFDEQGYIDVVDRIKDVIKSGGEWISSVELENELMAHEAISEASVIAIPHEKWQERPMACVVLKDGEEATAEELEAHLAETFPDWWLPDEYQMLDAIPRTSTGKFDKMALREQYGDE